MGSYKITFKGEVVSNHYKKNVEQILCKLLKIPIEKSDMLFDGRVYVLKNGISLEQASLFKAKFLSVGAVIYIEDDNQNKTMKARSSDIAIEKPDAKSVNEHQRCNSVAEHSHDSSNHCTKNDIDILNISKSWKVKFSKLESIGVNNKRSLYKVMDTQEYKNLGFWERSKLQFNLLAFLFGPFYYYTKGMWAKGSVMLSIYFLCTFLILFVSTIFSFQTNVNLNFLSSGTLCALFANYDYYKKMVYNEVFWPSWPKFLSTLFGSCLLLFFSLAMLCGMVWINISSSIDTPSYRTEVLAPINNLEPSPENMMLSDMSGVWRADSDDSIIKISLANNNKFLNVNEIDLPITVIDIDKNASAVTLFVTLINKNKVIWTIRQLIDASGNFTLQIDLHDGTKEHLSYIKDL